MSLVMMSVLRLDHGACNSGPLPPDYNTNLETRELRKSFKSTAFQNFRFLYLLHFRMEVLSQNRYKSEHIGWIFSFTMAVLKVLNLLAVATCVCHGGQVAYFPSSSSSLPVKAAASSAVGLVSDGFIYQFPVTLDQIPAALKEGHGHVAKGKNI